MITQPNTSPPRILIVDDNEDNRYTLILRLELEGYQNIIEAVDGVTALALLRKGNFDLVLLDVMMPNMDGYQVLEALKADGRLHSLPVIMISAVNEIDSVIRCIGLGAVDYLSKPFDPILLRARVSASIEKKRLRDEIQIHLARLEEELDSARQLQMSMVPAIFSEPTRERPIEIFAMMEPAREVGGDLYDFFYADDDTLCILVGDVSGKGVPSALFMARTKYLVRLVTRFVHESDCGSPQPAEIVDLANQELCQDNIGMMFVTLFFGMLSLTTGQFKYCSAGHPPAYRIASGAIEQLTEGRGRPLGIQANARYQAGNAILSPGDALYIYSDGITEAINNAGELFSEQRLEAILRNAPVGRIDTIVNSVGEAVKRFVGNTPQSDDITAMAVRLVDRRQPQ